MKQEDKAGLYTTVIIHLAVLIVLLATTLGFSLQKENSFVLDFSKLEELERLQAEVERLQQEAEFQQAISEKLQRELGAASGLDLCRTLLECNPRTNVVYLTAYPDYSLDAWNTEASGFMVKPLTAAGVREQLKKLRYPFATGGADE